MKEKSTQSLRQRQQELIRQLPPWQDILRGSIITRYKRCGKTGCKCAQGQGHGPKHYLSVSRPGRRPEMSYIPGDCLEIVRQFLENYRKIKEIQEELCEISRELLRRKEKR